MATPEEEIGYIATEEYASRLVTPAPESSEAQTAESKEPPPSEAPEVETPDVIHIDEPAHPAYDLDGFAPTPLPEERTETPKEGGDDEPILAADEVRPESAFMHPVVSPAFDRTPSAAGSRSSSRPIPSSGPISASDDHAASSREELGTSTPLEDVEEYEPLFPEHTKGKVIAPAERFKKRPEALRHKFPSEDVWEDSPNSFHLQTTVSTPDIPKLASKAREPESNPEQGKTAAAAVAGAAAGAAGIIGAATDHTSEKSLRPEYIKQRFPSRDIWEDAPESHNLVTTIEPSEDRANTPEAAVSKPSIPPRPVKRTPSHQRSEASSTPKSAARVTTPPVEERKPPVVPTRPKPHVPARPAKLSSRGSTSESLTKVSSGGSTGAAAEETREPALIAPKPKPAVPARPGGSKIAALKAGFLSDLNSRLQTGPQGPKPEEKKEASKPPVEKGPLNDARKGRARGPARRKPAETAKPAATSTASEVTMTEAWDLWQISTEGDLLVGNEVKEYGKEKPEKTPVSAVQSPSLGAVRLTASPLARNYAGEPVDPSPLLDTASTGTVETEVFTPHTKEPSPLAASSPAVELSQRSQSRSPPILEKTATQEAEDAHKSPAVEPSAATEKEDIPMPKLSSPDADSDIEIEKRAESPNLVPEAVENVESMIGKKLDESDVHTENEESNS